MARKKSWFFSVVRIVGLFIVGLGVAVFVALSRVNLETLRGDVIAVMRGATGLPVEIDGAVSWKFSLKPQIELNGVRVPNADWAKERDAFMAERVDVTLDLISLFRTNPTITNVKIYDLVINLERDDAGDYSIEKLRAPVAKNTLPENDDEKTLSIDVGAVQHENSVSELAVVDVTQDVKKEDVKPQVPLYPFEDFGLGGLEVKNLTANLFGKKYELAGFQVRYKSEDGAREYAGWVKADEDVYPFIVSLTEYNAERKVYPVRVVVATGGDALIANVALEGTSKIPIDFIVKGDVPNVALFGDAFGVGLPDFGAVKLNVSGGLEYEKLTIHKSSVIVRGNEIKLSGFVDWSKSRPQIVANLVTGRIDLLETFPEIYVGELVKAKREPNVFKDIPLYGDLLREFDLQLNADIGGLVVYRDLSIDDIDLKLNLKNGNADFDIKNKFADGDVHIGGDAIIDEGGRLYVRVATSAKSVSVGQILNQVHAYDLISGLPMNVNLYVEANGRNLSEIMQTITGPVVVNSVGVGQAYAPLVAYMYGTDFLTSLRHSIQDLFRSEKKYDQMQISCVALNTKLRNGVAEIRQGFAIETRAINLRLAGDLDLGAETMNLSLTTVPVRGIKLSLTGNVVNSIELTGNLAEPDVKISGAAVAGRALSATGIGLLLAPFTGGIGLVAGAGVGLLAGDLLENWLADDHPCESVMVRGAPARRGDPEWLGRSVTDLMFEIFDNK